jgi:hypothetical protein
MPSSAAVAPSNAPSPFHVKRAPSWGRQDRPNAARSAVMLISFAARIDEPVARGRPYEVGGAALASGEIAVRQPGRRPRSPGRRPGSSRTSYPPSTAAVARRVPVFDCSGLGRRRSTPIDCAGSQRMMAAFPVVRKASSRCTAIVEALAGRRLTSEHGASPDDLRNGTLGLGFVGVGAAGPHSPRF